MVVLVCYLFYFIILNVCSVVGPLVCVLVRVALLVLIPAMKLIGIRDDFLRVIGFSVCGLYEFLLLIFGLVVRALRSTHAFSLLAYWIDGVYLKVS